MSNNSLKFAWFVGGAAVGAVVSALATRKLVDETYRKAADDEIYQAWQESKARIKKYQDHIQELEEKISQQNVTIKTLADQVRRGGETPAVAEEGSEDDDKEDDPRPAVHKSEREASREREKETYHRYSRSYSAEEGDGPLEDDDYFDEDGELEEEIREKSGPEIISESDFANNCLEYGKEDLRYFLYDGKILTEDGEYLDNYAIFIGEKWKHFGRDAGDEVYVRNDHFNIDYHIIFTAGKGEESISMTDLWEDDD